MNTDDITSRRWCRAGLCLILSSFMFFPPAHAQFRLGKKQEPVTEGFRSLIERGLYAQAAQTAIGQLGRSARRKAEKGEVHGRSLQIYLLTGGALHWAGDHVGATAAFDQAELAIKDYETRILGKGALESAGAALLGNQVKAYRPKASDGILMNSLKAVSFMVTGRMADARVELHRADERTRRAVELFAKEIEKEQADADAKKDSAPGQVDSLISANYPELSHWEVYDDFVNPYGVFLHAIYFFSAAEGPSDIENASTSIKRLAGMYPQNQMLADDLLMIESVASGLTARETIPDMVWLICEDGIGPEVRAKNIDFALPIDNQAVPVRLVLPELAFNAEGSSGCAVQVEGELLQASEIGSMDRIARTEFKKRLPNEVTQGIAGAITRGALQNEVQKRGGLLGMVAGSIYQEKTATTETRVWEGLPKTWYALRVPRPADGILHVVTPDGSALATLTIPPAHIAMAHVRNPSAFAPPATSVAVLAASR